MENTDSKELDHQVDEVNNDEDQIREEEAIDAVQVKLDADEVDGVDDEPAVTINGDVNHINDAESMPPPQAQSAVAQHGDGLGEDQSGAGGKELEIDVNIHDESVMGDDPSLYDDVMMGSAAAKIEPRDGESEDKSSLSPSATGGSSGSQENGGSNGLQRPPTNQGPNNTNSHSSYGGGHQQKRVCCYVGNLTWWTNDKDLSDAIGSLQVADLIDIKFYENKVNGQSKGFALVTVGSDASFRTLMDKLPKCKLHGREPIVTHFSRHFFAQFEEQARKDFPSSAGSGSSGGGGNDHYQQQQQPSYGNNPNQQQQFFMNQRNRGNFGNGGGMNGNGTMSTGLPLSRPQQGGGGNMAPNGPMMSGPRGQQQGYMNGNGPGLVGPYPQNRMNGPQQGSQASQQQQSSLLGNTPPGMMPIRPGLASNSAQFAAGNRAPNGMMMSQQQQGPQVANQQTSLLGNRPGGGGGMIAQSNVPAANVSSQGPGLLPMRPGMTPIVAPNASQAPGLLNNPPGMPRMPQPQQPVNTQNAWDNRGNPVVGANGAMMPNAGMMAQMNPALANQQRVNQINPAAANQYGMTTPHHQYVTPQGQNPAMNTMNGGLIGAPPAQQHLYHPHHHPHQAQQPQTQSQPIPGHYATPYGQQPGVGVGIPQSASMHMQPQQQQIHQHHPVMTMTGGVDPSQQYHRQTSAGSVGLKMMPEMETLDALEKNRIITSQAISRAVHDSSIGQFASAIETLVMAISLIKQSKIANDERCKILVASLEDTKQAIEEKYYASLNMLQQQQQQQQQQPQRSYGREDSRERSSPSAPPSSRGVRGGGGGYERSRSRSRDSRDRDRDRDSGSSKEHRHHHRRGGGGSDKHHHRSSHRDRDRGRSRSRSRGDRRIVSVDRDDAYYDDAKYHRSSRH